MTEELVRLLREGPGFHLAGDFSRFPTQLYRLGEGPAEGRYLVDSTTQGPLLHGLLGRVNVVDDVPTCCSETSRTAPGTSIPRPVSGRSPAPN